MRNRIIESSDGFIWYDITEKSYRILESGVFPLYAVWKRDGNTFRVRVIHVEELDYFVSIGTPICIELSNESDKLDFVTLDSWNNADKINHEGYIYVRYADLSFCK